MSQLERILQRQPQIDEAEVEDVRARAIARLSAFSEPRAVIGISREDDASAATDDQETEGSAGVDDDPIFGSDALRSEAVRQVDIRVIDHLEPIALPLDGFWPPASDVPVETPRPRFSIYALGSSTPPEAADPSDDGLVSDESAGAQVDDEATEGVGAAHATRPVVSSFLDGVAPEAPAWEALDPFAPADPMLSSSNGASTSPDAGYRPTGPVVAQAHAPNAAPLSEAPPSLSQPRAADRKTADRKPATRRSARPRVAATAYCPYCALLLAPPPTSDSRCTRCRQRIMVRVVDGGMVVHLTEAAVKVFEAERQRAENIARWTSERQTWLDLARSAGAPASRVERLERSVASPDGIRSAQALYATAVDQAVQDALRRDLWEEAARSRRDQANTLRRLAERQLPPSDEMRDLYREAAAIELRGIATMARTAVVVGSRCCDACRADEGTVRKVVTELRSSRLPHLGCPNGLCRCRWDLSPHDVRMIQRYLVRTGRLRADAKMPDAAPSPEPALESLPG